VEKVDSEDPGGLGAQELSPGRARSAGSRIDARSAQDLPDGGWRDGHAEFRHFAVDPAVSPQRILLRQPNDKAGDAGDRRRPAGLAPTPRFVLARSQLAAPGQQRRWRHGEDFGPAPAGQEPGQRGEPCPVGRLVAHPAGVAAQHRVLVPEYQQFSILRQVRAGHQGGQAEYPAN
jgi:hypothetical protein